MTGVLLIDKPEGLTSFGTLIRVKKIIGQKKCGHTGTLDPMATGILTVMLGGATRFCELLPDHDKAYIAKIRLGIVTDTLDITGKVLETHDVGVSENDVLSILPEFTGKIQQIPPMFSAVSVDGQRLYDLARKGEEVERKPREAEIYSINLDKWNEEEKEFTLTVHCSSGTYIRTLADDMGRALGCGAVLTALRRVKANGFGIDRALTLEELEKAAASASLGDCLLSIESVLEAYPAIHVTAAQATRFGNGGDLLLSRLCGGREKGIYRVFGPEEVFLGLGENDGGDSLLVKKVFRGD